MAVLIKNIKKLVQAETAPIPFRAGKEMSNLPCIEDAYLLVVGDKIHDFGKMSDFSEKMLEKVKDPPTPQKSRARKSPCSVAFMTLLRPNTKRAGIW